MKLKQVKNNMTEVSLTENVKVLFSYETPVAMYDAETGYFHRTNKYWSRTTSKHINAWVRYLRDTGYIVSESNGIDQNLLNDLTK